MKIFILGSHENLSLAELEAQSSNVQSFCKGICLADTTADFNQLGGSIARADIVYNKTCKSTDLYKTILDIIASQLSNHSSKIEFGINWYGNYNQKISKKFGINLKKTLREQNVSSRYCMPKSGQVNLTSAQIKFNNLIEQKSGFIVGINATDSNNIKLIIGIIDQIQDIDNYSKRDYGRPCRDTKIGMLPPKLAQIMINLAKNNKTNQIIDPFCGNGVILAEALLMNLDAYGSDISQKMVDCTNSNLNWLKGEFNITNKWEVKLADARNFTFNDKAAAVICEGYLGPVDNYPTQKEKHDIKTLYLDSLKNIYSLVVHEQRVVIALPFWQKNQTVETLDILDQISSLGYNYTRFEAVNNLQLFYSRAHQRVGRQILVLEK